MTLTYTLQIDIHTQPDGPDGHSVRKVTPSLVVRIGKAVAQAIYVATTADFDGCEVLDDRIGQVTVTPVTTSDERQRAALDALAPRCPCQLALERDTVQCTKPTGHDGAHQNKRRMWTGDDRPGGRGEMWQEVEP